MEKHLIFMDIDGTLVDREQNISKKTRSLITELQHEGHQFYVATGRKFSSASQVAYELNPDTQVVASNGSIYSINEKIYKKQLTEEALVKVFETVTARELPIFFFGEHTIFYTQEMADHLKRNDRSRVTSTGEEDYIFLDSVDKLIAYSHRIVNGIVIAENRMEELPDLKQKLADSQLLSISSSHPNNIELIPLGVNKATAIQEIQRHTKIGKERTISFGDGLNDLEMLQASGIGVAMGNAVDELKQHADAVTDSNLEDGIANFLLKHFR